MRIGVISDIHGNGVALDAVLADVAGHPPDGWVCLGDAVQGGTQPLHVVERLRELACPVVMGNADAFVLDGVAGDRESISESRRAVREWTIDALGRDGLDYLRTFVPTCEVDLGEAGQLLCFHGSPDSFDTVLLPETPAEEIRRVLGSRHARWMCGGHTHLQWTTSIGESSFFNPGSVGLSYNRHQPEDRFQFFPVAQYAIAWVDELDVRTEFCQVPFDVDALDRAARASGHPNGDRESARFQPLM